MPKQSRLLLPMVVWAAAYLRLPAYFANHYHADEALFSSWSRLIAIWRDPLLSGQAVDKPPLLFYLQALFYPLFGAVEWASRTPDLVASILLVPLTAVLAWRLYRRQEVAVAAAIIVCLSPMAIQYSATAYTDPLVAAFLIAALALTGDEANPIWAGTAFGLAVATKYQAWLFLPLLGGIAWLRHWNGRHWLRWAIGLFLPLLALIVWAAARSGPLAIWHTQMSNFGGLRLAYSWELWPRLQAWVVQWRIVFGAFLILGLFAVIVAFLFAKAAVSRRSTNAVDLLLILFLAFYFLLHWLFAVPVWDRYLLPIIPIAALLLARGLVTFAQWLVSRARLTRSQKAAVAALLLAVLLFQALPAAVAARAGQWPTGGQPSADEGAWQVAEYLRDKPYGTVLYDHWYSWHWRYHFLDRGVYVSWFPTPAALTADLQVFAGQPGARYLVLPAGSLARPVLRTLEQAGYRLQEVYQTSGRPGIVLYQVTRRR